MAGGTGTVQADIEVTSIATSACTMAGPPVAVSLIRSDGSRLALTTRLDTPDPGSVSAVTLLPGLTATVGYNWSNWCGAQPGPLRVRIVLPNGAVLEGPLDGPPGHDFVPRCDAPASPSYIELLWGFIPNP